MGNGSYFKESPAHRSRTEDREQWAGWLIKEPEAGADDWLLPTDLSMDGCSSRHPRQEWGDGHQSQAGAAPQGTQWDYIPRRAAAGIGHPQHRPPVTGDKVSYRDEAFKGEPRGTLNYKMNSAKHCLIFEENQHNDGGTTSYK